MNKTLKQINDILNKANPSRLDLVEGCIFLDSNGELSMLLGKIINRTPIEKQSEYRYQMMDMGRWGSERLFSIYETSISDYTILGQKPTVFEVIQYIYETCLEPDKQEKLCKLFDVEVFQAGDSKPRVSWAYPIFDVSKQYVADQDENVQKQLLELMEK